jgi:hypothetical protein
MASIMSEVCMEDEKKPVGRPTTFSEELALRVCEEIAAGRSLNEICKQEDWAPDKSTFYRWMYRYADQLRDNYARARESQAMFSAEDILQAAYEATPDTYNVARLKVDAHKWVASKLLPRKFGDKQQLEHTGENGGPMIIKWKDKNEG